MKMTSWKISLILNLWCLKNNRLRWLFFKWRVDVENNVTNFWKTNNSNSSLQIDFVNCFLFLIQKRSAKRMCVCVYLSIQEEEIEIRNVVCEKSLFFVEFRNFCLLKSIFELIAHSFVNIKRREKKFISMTKLRSSSLHLRFVTNYKKFTLFVDIFV